MVLRQGDDVEREVKEGPVWSTVAAEETDSVASHAALATAQHTIESSVKLKSGARCRIADSAVFKNPTGEATLIVFGSFTEYFATAAAVLLEVMSFEDAHSTVAKC